MEYNNTTFDVDFSLIGSLELSRSYWVWGDLEVETFPQKKLVKAKIVRKEPEIDKLVYEKIAKIFKEEIYSEAFS